MTGVAILIGMFIGVNVIRVLPVHDNVKIALATVLFLGTFAVLGAAAPAQ